MNQDDNFNLDLEFLLKDLEEIDTQETQTQVLQQRFKNIQNLDEDRRIQQSDRDKLYTMQQQHHKAQLSIDAKTVQELLKELDLLDYKNQSTGQSFLGTHQQQSSHNYKSSLFNNFDKENSIIRLSTQANNKNDLQLSIIHQQMLQDHFLNNSIIQNTTINNINQNQNNYNANNNHQHSNLDDIDQFLRQLDDNNETVLYSSNLLNNTDVLR